MAGMRNQALEKTVETLRGECLGGKFWYVATGARVSFGLTGLGVDEVGSVQVFEAPDEGEALRAGDRIALIDGAEGSLELESPGVAAVIERNTAIEDEPERVMDDPLDEGWLVTIELGSVDDLKNLPE